MSDALCDADVDVLVLQSGRELERLGKALIPEERDADNQPIMLGTRMFRLREVLDDQTWKAYRAWAKDRNAYVHGESDSISDRDEFYENYRIVYDALDDLIELEGSDEEESYTGVALAVAVCVGLLVYAC